MMKTSKKVLALTMALAMAAPMAACSGKLLEGGVPDDRVELKISLYAGGYGTQWMDELIDRLNASQETYWYTRLDDNKTASNEIAGRILGTLVDADIYVTSPADVDELVVKEKLVDLSPVYNYTPEGEDQMIKEKTKGYHYYEKFFSDDNGIYVMPAFVSVNGLVYDHDLFKKMGWLYTDDNTENGLTKGADGKEGTYDDGLPVTYAEFKSLCDTIAGAQYTPFIYGDAIGFGQMQRFFECIWAQYEGIENYNISMNYNGTYISSDGTETLITPETGWKLYSDEKLQEGRIKAMQVASEMVFHSSKYMYSDRAGMSHTDAQGVYVTSHATKQIAMLFDGGWWENEAQRAFAEDAKNTNEDYAFGKRDFRIMPAPTFEGQHSSMDGKHAVHGGVGGSAFAVKPVVKDPKISDEQAAIKTEGIIQFFKEYSSDWNCKNYTKLSGCIFPMEYEMTQEELSGISKFAQNVFEIYNSDSTIMFEPYWVEKELALANPPTRWGTLTIGDATWTSHAAALKATSFADYVRGLTNDTWKESNWNK